MTKVVLMNGPAGSGKDAIGKWLSEALEWRTGEFKSSLYECAAELFEVPVELLIALNENRTTKEIFNVRLILDIDGFYQLYNYVNNVEYDGHSDKSFLIDGTDVYLSPRLALIYTSELIYKLIMGNGYFGELEANKITLEKDNGVVYTDSGFREEAFEVANKVGHHNTYVVRLYRDCCSFDGDSRNYWDSDFKTLVLNNDSSIEEAGKKIIEFINEGK